MPDTWYWSSVSSTSPSVSGNWTKTDGTTGVPVTGDTVYIQPIPGLTLASIAYADMHTVQLAAMYISAGLPNSFTIGTQDTTSGNFFGYWEIGATICVIGAPTASAQNGNIVSQGPGRIKLKLGSSAAAVTVQSTTSSSTDVGYEPVRISAASSSTTITVESGLVGVATNLPGETSTIGTAIATGSGSQIDLGPGVTVTTVQAANSGTVVAECAATTATIATNSTLYTSGTGEVTTLNNSGAAYISSRATATIGTMVLYPGSTTDFSGNPATATITNTSIYSNANGTIKIQAFQANPNQIIYTNPPTLYGNGLTTYN